MTNPAMMGNFMKFVMGLDKALTKRDKKDRAQNLGLGGGEDSSEDDDEDSHRGFDSDDSSDDGGAISVPADDIDNFTHNYLSNLAAQMGCDPSELRKPGAPPPQRTESSEEDAAESEEEQQEKEMMTVMMKAGRGEVSPARRRPG